MTLSPTHPRSWSGFLEMLRPPPGYCLEAALGTTYGLSFDALVAALLAMDGRQCDDVTRDPIGAVVAATRLSTRVRILLQPGSIDGHLEKLPSRLLGMLDRVLVPVRVTTGLFHPKVWALSFLRLERPEMAGSPKRQLRVLVSSRNLARSRAFEIGAVFEGFPSPGAPGALGREIADVLGRWWRPPPQSSLLQLLAALRETDFDPPDEGREAVYLWHQGMGATALEARLPRRLGRAILVTPYLRSDFLRTLLERTDELRIVSAPEALADLPADVFALVEERAAQQRSPLLYVVAQQPDADNDHGGDPQIDGIHAKILISQDGDRRTTFLGSANGTGPAWHGANVEAMVELRPGISMDGFVRAFLLKEKGQPHPWIEEFTRADWEKAKADPTEDEAEKLLRLLRGLAGVRLTATYDRPGRVLGVRCAEGTPLPRPDATATVEVAPLSQMGVDAAWRPFESLTEGVVYDEVALADVSAFVAIRARRGDIERVRLTLVDLTMPDGDRDDRDEEARRALLERAAPEDVLRSLVRGLLGGPAAQGAAGRGGSAGPGSTSAMFDAVTLEHLLSAVAEDPTLVRDVRLLLAGRGDPAFDAFCEDLEQASGLVRGFG